MNRILIAAFVAATAAAAGQAFADTTLAGDISIDPHPFVGTRTRADVQAELAGFRASGVNPWADEYNPVAQFHSTRTPDEVKAEFMQSRNEVSAMNGEDSGSAYLASRQPQGPVRVMAGDPAIAAE